MSAHTDIVATGWVARMPSGWRPYLLLARLDRPIGVWLLFLPGVWGILLAMPPWQEALRLIVLFGVGSVVMRAAGCTVNDLWDRDIDRMVARTAARPLASGALRPRHALVFLSVLLLVGLAILMQLNRLSQALGVASLILVALYPLAKRVTWWPQLMMGFTFGFGAPMGYAAAADRLGVAWALIYAGAIVWDLGFDTIYAHQDREDDAPDRRQIHGPPVWGAHEAVPGGVLRCDGGRAWRRGLCCRFARLVLPDVGAAGFVAGSTGRRTGYR